MTKPNKLFRYSGSKDKIIPLLRPLLSHKRLVEPYLGGGSFLLRNSGPGLGIEFNTNVVDLWHYLQGTTAERLWELERLRKEACDAHPNNKPDVRSLNLNKGEETYVRINTSGVYVGQLSSWVLYPQHKLPVAQTIANLERIQNITVLLGKAQDYNESDGDIVFLDPPYKDTFANYKQDGKSGIEEGYEPQQTIDLISRLKSPIIFTYGTKAKEIFPMYDWEEVLKKKVPKIRTGGTVERTEHVAYINWK